MIDGVIFVASTAAMLATLTTFASDLHEGRLHKLPRPARAGLAVVWLGISLVSGIMWSERKRPEHGGTTMGEPAVRRVSDMPVTISTRSAATSVPAPITAATVTTASAQTFARQLRPLRIITAPGHDEITIDEQVGSLPEVHGAADDALNMLRSQFYTVRGHLRSTQSQPDEGLQGLITTDLTLDVTLTDIRGGVRDAFTVTSRGGGFRRDSSASKARERLREVLQEHLQKEHP